jgi:hypothetical protein
LVATNVTQTPANTLQIAQEFGVSKYLEVQTNLYHITEIFAQTVNAIRTFQNNSDISIEQRIHHSSREREYFKTNLTVPPPEGDFDQMERTFDLNVLQQVNYYYTIDETNPTFSSLPFTQKIKLKSGTIKVRGYERCKYASIVSDFTVPGGMFCF